MGHEEYNKTELLLGKDSYVVPWTDPVQKDYGEVRLTTYTDDTYLTKECSKTVERFIFRKIRSEEVNKKYFLFG